VPIKGSNSELDLPQKQNRRKLSLPPVFFQLSKLFLRGFGHVRRLGSFRALHDLEFYRISFLQCPVSIADDR
jgi:hypothetical protein